MEHFLPHVVSVRNRSGVACSIGERYEKNMDVYQGI